MQPDWDDSVAKHRLGRMVFISLFGAEGIISLINVSPQPPVITERFNARLV